MIAMPSTRPYSCQLPNLIEYQPLNGPMNNRISNQHAAAAALEEYRQKKWDNYLQDARLDNGEYYGGFVAFKDSNYKHYIINITLGGHAYTFYING